MVPAAPVVGLDLLDRLVVRRVELGADGGDLRDAAARERVEVPVEGPSRGPGDAPDVGRALRAWMARSRLSKTGELFRRSSFPALRESSSSRRERLRKLSKSAAVRIHWSFISRLRLLLRPRVDGGAGRQARRRAWPPFPRTVLRRSRRCLSLGLAGHWPTTIPELTLLKGVAMSPPFHPPRRPPNSSRFGLTRPRGPHARPRARALRPHWIPGRAFGAAAGRLRGEPRRPGARSPRCGSSGAGGRHAAAGPRRLAPGARHPWAEFIACSALEREMPPNAVRVLLRRACPPRGARPLVALRRHRLRGGGVRARLPREDPR